MALFQKTKQYRIIYIIQEHGSYRAVKSQDYDTIPDKFLKTAKDKTTYLDITKPAYRTKKNTLVYYIDSITGKQLHFAGELNGITPEDLDTAVGSKLISQIVKGIAQDKRQQVLMVIAGLIVGALICAVIIISVYQGKIANIYNEFLNAERNNTIIIQPL